MCCSIAVAMCIGFVSLNLRLMFSLVCLQHFLFSFIAQISHMAYYCISHVEVLRSSMAEPRQYSNLTSLLIISEFHIINLPAFQ